MESGDKICSKVTIKTENLPFGRYRERTRGNQTGQLASGLAVTEDSPGRFIALDLSQYGRCPAERTWGKAGAASPRGYGHSEKGLHL